MGRLFWNTGKKDSHLAAGDLREIGLGRQMPVLILGGSGYLECRIPWECPRFS